MSWLVKIGTFLKGLFGAGDVAAEKIDGAAVDRRAATDLAASAGNVAEADRIAAEAGVSPAAPASTEEPTPPASPAARRVPG